MKHVFLDASVLIAFCASKVGASAEILKYCRERKIKGHISRKVILEVQKNTSLKLGETARKRFEAILKQSFLTIEPDPPQEQIEKCGAVIHPKDATILASALFNTDITDLVTLDRKDFKKPEVITFSAPVEIRTPGEFVERQKKQT